MPEDMIKALSGGAGVQQILDLARRHLGMDVALLGEFTDGEQVYRGVAGDASSFGCVVDAGTSLSDTYCHLMTTGEIPNAIPDARAHPLVGDLPATRGARIGSYVGVPIRLADGSLYGSLCTLSHDVSPVDAKDARFLYLLADLLSSDIQASREQAKERARICGLIDNKRLQVALQPIIDINSGRLRGVEALSRFPEGFGSPDVVFDAAHQVGVGVEMERLAFATAFELLPLLGTEAYLAVNLTPSAAIELSQAPLTPGLRLDRVVLEITEHAAVESYARLRDCLAEARERGLRLAIDDAGAGFASLHHIVELQPDVIKIDRSLVHGISSDRARGSVVKAFVALAADLAASVVAEGVEEVADLVTVQDLGVDAAQGYLFAKPSTNRADVGAWLRRSFIQHRRHEAQGAA